MIRNKRVMGVRLAMNSGASHRRPEEQPPKLLASSSTLAVVLPDSLSPDRLIQKIILN